MRRRLFSLCIGACVVAMAACGIPAGGTSDSVTGGGVSSSPPVQSESGSDGGSEEKAASVTIYVGTDGEYAEFPVEYTGERLETGQVPVTEVLSAMAKITGWNLDLADQIYSGKGGITVTFADTCTLLDRRCVGGGGPDGNRAAGSAGAGQRQKDPPVLGCRS